MTPKTFVLSYGPRLARDYSTLQHVPSADETASAYHVFTRELLRQWDSLWSAVRLTATDNGHIYPTSKAMFTDISRGHLYYFTGGELPADHPLSAVVSGHKLNDIFRAVHDYYGHYPGRYAFSALGEEHAFRRHAGMFSYEGIKALATETRGQNAWFNFGPHAHLPRNQRPYADQKAGLLPLYAWRKF